MRKFQAIIAALLIAATGSAADYSSAAGNVTQIEQATQFQPVAPLAFGATVSTWCHPGGTIGWTTRVEGGTWFAAYRAYHRITPEFRGLGGGMGPRMTGGMGNWNLSGTIVVEPHNASHVFHATVGLPQSQFLDYVTVNVRVTRGGQARYDSHRVRCL